MPILPSISGPRDLDALSTEQLVELAELRLREASEVLRAAERCEERHATRLRRTYCRMPPLR